MSQILFNFGKIAKRALQERNSFESKIFWKKDYQKSLKN